MLLQIFQPVLAILTISLLARNIGHAAEYSNQQNSGRPKVRVVGAKSNNFLEELKKIRDIFEMYNQSKQNLTFDCSVKLSFLQDKTPILLKSSDNYTLQPDLAGLLYFKIGESYRISCQNPYMLKKITCEANNTFVDESSKSFTLSQIKCLANFPLVKKGNQSYIEAPNKRTEAKPKQEKSLLEEFFLKITSVIALAIPRFFQDKLGRSSDCSVWTRLIPSNALYMQALEDEFIKTDHEGFYDFKKNESFRIICESPNITKTITCKGNQIFVDETSQRISPYKINCTRRYEQAIFTGNKCINNNSEISVGYKIPNIMFIPILQICFNEETKEVLFSKQIISTIQKFPLEIKESDIEGLINYNSMLFGINEHEIEDSYDISNQMIHINKLLDLPLNSTKYLDTKTDNYIDKVQLSSYTKDDIFLHYSINSYYVNTAPMWHTVKKGNWKALTEGIQKYVFTQGNITDDIYMSYTGTYGRSKLENKEIYLKTINEKKIMFVPEIFWKILYNQKTQQGYVFLVLNNPYLKSYTPFCKNTCPGAPPIPINWQKNNRINGLAYCCELENFMYQFNEII